ncbi:unnamed protein product [Leptosia nina]|uniref:Uncharacterized protein n=1 Tax=Leptosia nina TaxID=320188 RepID=A0AAV1K106_9NEOP
MRREPANTPANINTIAYLCNAYADRATNIADKLNGRLFTDMYNVIKLKRFCVDGLTSIFIISLISGPRPSSEPDSKLETWPNPERRREGRNNYKSAEGPAIIHSPESQHFPLKPL